jgi:cystathionine beta-lyase
VSAPFEELSVEDLRRRGSIKWRESPADVLPLWIAEMDVMPPPSVVDELQRMLRDGDLGYAPLDTAYADSYARVAQRRWGLEVDVASVVPCADVITGVARAIATLSSPGDSVVVPTPVYPPLLMLPAEAGREVIEVAATAEGRLDLDALAVALADPSAMVLLLCSPHNPTGVVHTADELRAVAAMAADAGVEVVVDEIHALVVPDGTTFVPWLSVNDGGIVVTSASKAYNMAGLKSALVQAGPASAEFVASLPLSVKYGASYSGQRAHIAAWDGGDAWMDAVNANIVDNVALLRRLLDEHLPEVGYVEPASTYLAWLDCRPLGLGDDPAAVFLERGRVALNSGLLFGEAAKGFARINLACSADVLTDAVRRMAASV